MVSKSPYRDRPLPIPRDNLNPGADSLFIYNESSQLCLQGSWAALG